MPLGANKAAIMGVAGVSTADVVLIADNTSDITDLATVSFTSGIDSTYGEYIFGFYNVNPATDGGDFQFQCSTDGGSNYNTTLTSTFFRPYSYENGAAAALGYQTSHDQAQGTAFQSLANSVTSDGDGNTAGTLHLFNPSSTTYVKHFYSRLNYMGPDGDIRYSADANAAGYFNTTSAVNAIQFKMASGNFDGTIKMWGVK